MVKGNHWDQWFSDGFQVRKPLVTMVFDGCAPSVRRWNGYVPSLKSKLHDKQQGKVDKRHRASCCQFIGASSAAGDCSTQYSVLNTQYSVLSEYYSVTHAQDKDRFPVLQSSLSNNVLIFLIWPTHVFICTKVFLSRDSIVAAQVCHQIKRSEIHKVLMFFMWLSSVAWAWDRVPDKAAATWYNTAFWINKLNSRAISFFFF